MIRILVIVLGTIAIYQTDLQSGNFFKSTLFPLFNIYYLFFLFRNFLGFLYKLRASGTKGNEVNIVDFLYDIITVLYEEISSKYAGSFDFMGKYSGLMEDLVVPIEMVCVVVSFYQELQLLAYLAD